MILVGIFLVTHQILETGKRHQYVTVKLHGNDLLTFMRLAYSIDESLNHLQQLNKFACSAGSGDALMMLPYPHFIVIQLVTRAPVLNMLFHFNLHKKNYRCPHYRTANLAHA